jgi:hypothetical protein
MFDRTSNDSRRTGFSCQDRRREIFEPQPYTTQLDRTDVLMRHRNNSPLSDKIKCEDQRIDRFKDGLVLDVPESRHNITNVSMRDDATKQKKSLPLKPMTLQMDKKRYAVAKPMSPSSPTYTHEKKSCKLSQRSRTSVKKGGKNGLRSQKAAVSKQRMTLKHSQ